MENEFKYSAEAQALLDEMPNFDRQQFEAWWFEQMHVIGSRNILQFLMAQRRADDIKAKTQ